MSLAAPSATTEGYAELDVNNSLIRELTVRDWQGAIHLAMSAKEA